MHDIKDATGHCQAARRGIWCDCRHPVLQEQPGAQQFLGSWDAALQGSSNATEQAAFNAVVRRGMRPLKTHAGNYRIFYGMDGGATFGVLPLGGFLNGHGYFVQRLHEVRRLLTYGRQLRHPDTHLGSS